MVDEAAAATVGGNTAVNCALKSSGSAAATAAGGGAGGPIDVCGILGGCCCGTGEEMTVLGLGLGGNIIGNAVTKPGPLVDWFWLLLAFGRCRGATLVPLSSCLDEELNEATFD